MASRADETAGAKQRSAKTRPTASAGRVSFHIYIDQRLKRRVRQFAQKQKRNLNAQVEVLLTAALKAEGWEV